MGGGVCLSYFGSFVDSRFTTFILCIFQAGFSLIGSLDSLQNYCTGITSTLGVLASSLVNNLLYKLELNAA